MQRYSDEEYEKLVKAAADLGPRYLVLVLLGGDAGLRLGEVVALEWTDIDFKRRYLTVNRQERRGRVGKPKGGRAREIPLSDRLAAALEHLKAARCTIERRVLARDPNYRWDKQQDRVKDRTLKNWMELVERRAGLGVTGRVHILRHTFCSRLVDAGAYPRDIQKLAGHVSLSTTEKYMHDSDEGKFKAIALLNQKAG
jgi:integrase